MKTAFFIIANIFAVALVLLCMSGVPYADVKTGGAYRIESDAVNISGSYASGSNYVMIYAAGQTTGAASLYQTPGNPTSGYFIETGFAAGIEAVFSTFTLTTTASAPTDLGYLGSPSDTVPGAELTYILAYTNAGEAAINTDTRAIIGGSNVIVDIQIPPETDYKTGTIVLNSVAQTDLTDGDSCHYDSINKKAICSILMTAGATGNMQFKAILK